MQDPLEAELDQVLRRLAGTAASYQNRPGREWKSLQDTTNDPIIAMRRPIPSRSWQRSEDYYSEGELVWLDADTLIRERSGGKKSLDDFARGFFGINNGSWVSETYTLRMTPSVSLRFPSKIAWWQRPWLRRAGSDSRW